MIELVLDSRESNFLDNQIVDRGRKTIIKFFSSLYLYINLSYTPLLRIHTPKLYTPTKLYTRPYISYTTPTPNGVECEGLIC